MQQLISEIRMRLQSETPKFFKGVRKLGGGICATCSAVIAVPTIYTGAVLPATVMSTATHLLVAGVILVTLSSLTKTDTSQ